jgi:predicted dehydrogenase
MKILVVGAGMYVTGRGGTGAGTILASLAQASRTMPVEEVLVVARNPANATAVAEATQRINGLLGSALKVRYQALTGDLGDAVKLEDYGAAIVCVPDHLHFEVASQLLERGVPSLIVKPLTPTVAEAKELIAIQQKSGAYAAVEFHKRWDESNLSARRTITDGKLGALVYGVVEYSQRISIPTEVFKGWAERTNIFQYLGCHYVDLFHFLTGLVPLRAMAVGTRGVLASRGVNTWDSVHAQVVWAGGFVSQLTISWIDPTTTSALSDQRIKIIGEKGRIELDQKDRGIELVTQGDGVLHPNPYFADYLPSTNGGLEFQGYGHRSIAAFVGDVIDLKRGARTLSQLEALRPTLRRSLISTAVVEAVNRSLSEDQGWRPIDATA